MASDLALSVRQPEAYLAGCLKGDAWLSAPQKKAANGYLCIRVSDFDFADAFAEAITVGFGVQAEAKPDERGYALVRKCNGYNRFTHLLTFQPVGPEQTAAWLRGLFDSEGNAQCTKLPRGSNCWGRRIAFFSTEKETLQTAEKLLTTIGISAVIRDYPHSKGHKGTKPVFILRLTASHLNFKKFQAVVGTSIARKRAGIAQIVDTYHPDLAAAYRSAQAKGAAIRRQRRDAGGNY